MSNIEKILNKYTNNIRDDFTKKELIYDFRKIIKNNIKFLLHDREEKRLLKENLNEYEDKYYYRKHLLILEYLLNRIYITCEEELSIIEYLNNAKINWWKIIGKEIDKSNKVYCLAVKLSLPTSKNEDKKNEK